MNISAGSTAGNGTSSNSSMIGPPGKRATAASITAFKAALLRRP
jgi:hypothetical protein